MSKMSDYRIWITEKIMKLDPSMTWEDASDFIDHDLPFEPDLIKKLHNEYMEAMKNSK